MQSVCERAAKTVDNFLQWRGRVHYGRGRVGSVVTTACAPKVLLEFTHSFLRSINEFYGREVTNILNLR